MMSPTVGLPWSAKQRRTIGQEIFFVGTINPVRVIYDKAKSQRNEEERGLPFAMAENFDWSSALIVEDTREDYRERRYQALGYMDEHLHMLVFTPRDGAVHVISLRRANRRERIRYAAQTQP